MHSGQTEQARVRLFSVAAFTIEINLRDLVCSAPSCLFHLCALNFLKSRSESTMHLFHGNAIKVKFCQTSWTNWKGRAFMSAIKHTRASTNFLHEHTQRYHHAFQHGYGVRICPLNYDLSSGTRSTGHGEREALRCVVLILFSFVFFHIIVRFMTKIGSSRPTRITRANKLRLSDSYVFSPVARARRAIRLPRETLIL